MAQHLLIATATSTYPNLRPEDQRPQLSGVLASIVDLFTRTLGRYRRELETVGENPSADALRKALDRWFTAPERDPADWVVLYYTGHAEIVNTHSHSLYLLTSDFEPPKYVGTAFSLRQLADVVTPPLEQGQRRRVRNLLLIIDTCFAGTGVPDLVSQLSSVFRTGAAGSFYVLGAALPRQEAQAGALARALIDAIGELSTRCVQQKWLYLDQIVPAINQRLRVHQAVLAAVTSTEDEPQFFPNPNWVETHGLAVPADEAQRAISDQDFRDHWGPRGRGVEFDSQPGGYFSGRKAVLRKLCAFLKSDHDHRTRVVTGRPGSGKSAILSQIVRATQAGARTERAALDGDVDFPAIDLAVHAKGKSLLDVTRSFAGRLRVEARPETVVEHLRQMSGPIRIVVDALDEAAEPAAIASRLLRPLNDVQSVKLLVGTRMSQLDALRGAEVIDIDSREHAEADDITRYVVARLLRADEAGQPTPYAGRDDLARRIAAAVEAKAYPNFLVARLIVEDLLLRSRPVNPDAAAEMAFPSRVASALDAYLARFGDRETMVRDIARPLAFAEGQGLPWDNVWAPLASLMADRSYGDDDVRWVLEHAGAFILESVEDGRSVYRLYHQALADALRRRRKPKRVDAIFTKILTSSVPRRAEGTGIDWFLASRYVRGYLAKHAARCGQLGHLVNDPLYLLAADPTRLLPVVVAHGNQVPRKIAAVYKETIHHIREESPATAASYLELAARQRGSVGARLLDEIVALPLTRPWRAAWARWTPRMPSHSFGKDDSEVCALSAALWGSDRHVALVGRRHGAVEIWDIVLGDRLILWKPDKVESTWRLALIESEAGTWLVASWHTGQIGVFDLDTRKGWLVPDAQGHGPVSAMCSGDRQGQPVCVTAHEDGTLVVRALPSLEPVVERTRATKGNIYGLRVVRCDNETIVVSIGDSNHGTDKELDHSMLRMWSLDDLSLRWEDAREQRGVLQNIEESWVGGRPVIVVSQDHWGPLQVWDLEQRRMLFEDGSRSGHAWMYDRDGRNVLVDVSSDVLTARDVESCHIDGQPALVASRFGHPLQFPGRHFSSIFQLSARGTVLSELVDHVRVWDIEDILDEVAKGDIAGNGPVLSVTAVAASTDRPGELYTAVSNTVVALDTVTGDARWERRLERAQHWERVSDIAAVTGQHWLVATMGDAIHVLDLAREGRTVRVIPITGTAARVRTARWQARPLAFATVESKGIWAMRIWDLETGEEVPTGRAYQLWTGEEDKQMHGLALAETPTAIRAAFASKYGKIMVADFVGALIERQFPRAYHEWRLPTSRGEYVECLAVGHVSNGFRVAAGTEEGQLAVWDLVTGDPTGNRPSAHLGAISAAAFGVLAKEPVVVTGGKDGMVRLWTVSLDERLAIDVGEPVTAVGFPADEWLVVGTHRGLVAFELTEPGSPPRA